MTSKIVRADGTEITGIKSVTYTEKVNADIDLRPGCVASACIVAEVFGSQGNAPGAGEALTYYQVDSEENETLIGVFYAEPAIPSRMTYAFTAYDAAYKLNTDFSGRLAAIQNDFPMTLLSLVQEACNVAGVTLVGTFPMSYISIGAFYADGVTCRQIVSWAAELACRFVRCDTAGNLKFDWYAAVTDVITPGAGTNGEIYYKQSGLTYENYDTPVIGCISLYPVDEENIAYVYKSTTLYPANDVFPSSYIFPSNSESTMVFQNNLLVNGATATDYVAIAQNIYEQMALVTPYRPASVELFTFNNPFRAGDIVTITDIQGVTFTTPFMSMTVTSESAKLESTGNSTIEDVVATLKDTLLKISDSIVRIRKLKVDWADIGTAIIQTLEAQGINADWINAGQMLVSFIKLFGSMDIYSAEDSSTIGGQFGFIKTQDDSYNDVNGVGMLINGGTAAMFASQNYMILGQYNPSAVWADGGDLQFVSQNLTNNIKFYTYNDGLLGDAYMELNGNILINGVDPGTCIVGARRSGSNIVFTRANGTTFNVSVT